MILKYFLYAFMILSITDTNILSNGGMMTEKNISLPKPKLAGKLSLEETISKRRTVRSFSNKPISIEELSQLLWACQGITSTDGKRTAPSAGALYPLEVFAVAGNVKDLDPGIYRYIPESHSMQLIAKGDHRRSLAGAALGQEQIITASVDILISVVYERLSRKYGDRSVRYAHIEVGHAAQNVLLQAQSLGLGVCPIGAFHDDKVKKVLQLKDEEPIYILTVGR
ncbi:MAG: SagB/ThcOx family dehydrogenase [Bacteroidetes bacterium]|nr:SagB/ThcOx family dehydrogenase [Bacteroidota bacterium]